MMFSESDPKRLAQIALVVLLIVSLGGVFADVLSDIARGRVPAGLMLAQLGLQVLNYLPLILPLGLMLGLMMAVFGLMNLSMLRLDIAAFLYSISPPLVISQW